jgi:formylglycine-generating enzyme
MNHRLIILTCWACCLCFVSNQIFADSAPGSLVGLSKDKPASGPSVAVDGQFMIPYTVVIPGTEVSFEMIPIPGGKVKLGSPDSEEGRSDDEGPQVEVEIAPFWMAKTEVTWNEYKVFMALYSVFKKLQTDGIRKITDENQVDAITAPTPLYEPSHTFEFGDDPQQPAITMTQYAAKQYSKWLSGMLGTQYRIPTEAEWEYAARAGKETAYCFGDSPDQLNDYACFEDNNPGGPAKVASKKPNAFGLYDMHGNVWEWTIDAYTEAGFEALAGKDSLTSMSAIQWSTEAFPRCVRGGGWQDPADRLRSAARLGSNDEDWKDQDPNVPLSPWWFTSDPARMVGMRLVRSVKPLSSEELKKFWEIDHADIEFDVKNRIDEGRAAIGLPVPELSENISQASQ